ncbi:uncharacterized protein EI97DRAFT_84420 [Westerdykella ornata]|uniref:Uncharacterized protein n=1 Tax=Westerdykella ornata TaxID=318751 RepID=A0A6A6JFL5_WESOR|nr:uncharacterized protein EI97DRAFT_84420 [Westerdykella ornata]KAF2275004.1 hypothetical protein EI97DRAFT_84420 [Westerdykella ornata]
MTWPGGLLFFAAPPTPYHLQLTHLAVHGTQHLRPAHEDYGGTYFPRSTRTTWDTARPNCNLRKTLEQQAHPVSSPPKFRAGRAPRAAIQVSQVKSASADSLQSSLSRTSSSFETLEAVPGSKSAPRRA